MRGTYRVDLLVQSAKQVGYCGKSFHIVASKAARRSLRELPVSRNQIQRCDETRRCIVKYALIFYFNVLIESLRFF